MRELHTTTGEETQDEDPAHTRAIHLERARKLGRRLRLEVVIDETGWLRREIELVLTKEPGGFIQPVTVRIGREASDDDLLARGGVLACCKQYNAAIVKLRQLGEQLAAMVRQGQITLDPGSPLTYAHRELSRLDELIDQRQRITMGHGVVRLAALGREIEFFGRCDAHLAPIVLAAERAVSTVKINASLPQRARRWSRWFRLGR